MKKSIGTPHESWFYEDARRLGPPGGFAQVYAGDGNDGRPIAIKIFHTTDVSAAERELTFAKNRIGHYDQHVLPIYGCGVDEATRHPYIVMARADISLEQKLGQDGPMSEADAVAAALAIVRGLLAVKTWIHRDLKPANVLRYERLWHVADFGIARVADVSTAKNTMKGYLSAHYAAPEQWDMERSTHATDVYALGCVLHELMTGQPLFNATTFEDLAQQHRLEVPKLTAGSPSLRAMMQEMVAKSPKVRPNLEELERWFAARQEVLAPSQAANDLASAAAAVAEVEASDQAQDVSLHREKQSRQTIEADALNDLNRLSTELFATIEVTAPNAKLEFGREGRFPVRLATLGKGSLSLTVGQFRSLSKEEFMTSGWDVVCGDYIMIEQANGYRRSASLWYVRREEDGPYEWLEASYFHWGGSKVGPEPCYLPPGRDADLAASMTMHNWVFAHPVRSFRGEGRKAFIDRWLGYFAAAAQGKLQSPSNLPEER